MTPWGRSAAVDQLKKSPLPKKRGKGPDPKEHGSPSVTLLFLYGAVGQSDLLTRSKARPAESRDRIVSSQAGFGILEFACLSTGDTRDIIVLPM